MNVLSSFPADKQRRKLFTAQGPDRATNEAALRKQADEYFGSQPYHELGPAQHRPVRSLQGGITAYQSLWECEADE